ncbi:MAG TPA: hypothetical protein VJ400_07365 [Thermoplasmata archaeon]|nr:hypothetical protein [Thermoplasmata archaeon]
MTDHWVLVALRIGIVAAGSLVGLWSLRLGLRRRERRVPYLLLATGFGLLTLGSVVEGVLFEFAGWALSDAHVAEAAFTVAGFVLVLVSILRRA